MDKKTTSILATAKFMAYGTLFIGIVADTAPEKSGALYAVLALIVSGSIRQFYLYDTAREHYALWLFPIDLALAAVIGFTGYLGLDMIIYFLVISESALSFPSWYGLSVLLLSCLSVSLIGFAQQGMSTAGWLSMIAGCLFAYTVSLISRRMMEQSAELRAALAALDDSKKELEATHRALLASQMRNRELAVMEERTRMAREIHDTLAHSLTAMVITIEAAKKLISRGGSNASELLENAQEQARQGLGEVRLSVKQMRDSLPGGLRVALQDMLEQLATGSLRFELNLAEDLYLTKEQETTLYRVVQEACTNAIRHGQASTIHINLRSKGGNIVLQVQDNGAGCADIHAGNGLIGMRERLQAIGGTLEIHSSAGQGFCVCAQLQGDGGTIHG